MCEALRITQPNPGVTGISPLMAANSVISLSVPQRTGRYISQRQSTECPESALSVSRILYLGLV